MLTAVSAATPEASPRRCKYPGCDAAVPTRPPGRPGAPREFCDHPGHNAQKYLRYKLKAATDAEQAEPAPRPLRPVTDGTVTLAALVDRIDQLRHELGAVVADTADLITDITDPAAIEREISQARRDTALKVSAAEQAQADAEQALARMTRERDRAVELEQLALAAVREATADAEDARALADRVQSECTTNVTAAQEDRDRMFDEAETALKQMRQQYDTACIAQARAEADRDAARAKAAAAGDENTVLRTELEARRNCTTDSSRHGISNTPAPSAPPTPWPTARHASTASNSTR